MAGSDSRVRTLVKLGGELLEDETGLGRAGAQIARLASAGPLVVVHGGGRTIDAELTLRGVAKRTVDGLRITDAPTLAVVVAVLAGQINTRLVAALVARGVHAVGLTGADAGIGLVEPAPPHRAVDGRQVELGLVGTPVAAARPRLITDLCAGRYVPIIASLGLGRDGRLYNVNADTWAAHLATRLGVDHLIIAGGTAGVLDGAGRTIDRLDLEHLDRVVASGTASTGMVAKLAACRHAVEAGVGDVRIVDGRASEDLTTSPGTIVGRRPAAGSADGAPGFMGMHGCQVLGPS